MIFKGAQIAFLVGGAALTLAFVMSYPLVAGTVVFLCIIGLARLVGK